MLLELAGACAVDRPVAGVVWAHRQLVDDETAGRLEQLYRQHPGHVELLGEAHRDRLCICRERRADARCRRNHLDAYAVLLHGLNQRPREHLAGGTSCDLQRELVHQRHPLLDVHVRAGQFRGWFGQHPHAAAVVTAAYRLEHNRPAVLLTERRDVRR